jgi:hypothetical protein
MAVNVELVQLNDADIVGIGTANPAEATAAASTRLIERFMYMVYLEKRWRRATGAQSKPCASYGNNLMTMTFSLGRRRRTGDFRGQTVDFVWVARS